MRSFHALKLETAYKLSQTRMILGNTYQFLKPTGKFKTVNLCYNMIAIVIMAHFVLTSCDSPKSNYFNLGFEKTDETGTKPAGWQISEYSDYRFSLDSEQNYKGSYSLKIEKKKNSTMPFGGFASIRLAGISQSQHIKVTGFIKTENTTVDSIGLYIHYQNSEHDKTVTISDSDLTGTHPWDKYMVESTLEFEPEMVYVGAFFTGEGTMWVDEIMIYVDNKPFLFNPDSPQYEINEDEISWLRKHLVPITTVEAENGFNDLLPLKEAIGDAHIVALGENTHGTSEVFKMKHRLIEFLFTEMDFDIFSIEANMPEAYRLNDYVLGGAGDQRQLLSGMYFWTWDTQEVLDLIQWMRKINQEGEKKIQFTGFDMQFYPVALDNLIDYVDGRKPVLKTKVDSLSSMMKRLPFDRYGKQISDNDISICKDLCSSIISQLKYIKYNNIDDKTELDWTLQNTRVIQQFLELRRLNENSFEHRDRSMADNVSWILEHNPDSKIVLWAHNGHINYKNGTMGKFLSTRYKEDYYALGFLSGSGTYTAVNRNVGVVSDNILAESEPGSVEYNLRKSGVPIFFLDFSAVNEHDPDSQWLNSLLNYRSIGAMAMENQFYPTIITKKFDAIIYLDNTHASNCFRTKN